MNNRNYYFLQCIGILLLFISCSTTKPYQRHSGEVTGYENSLTVRVKIVLLQRDDGSGNFDLKNPEEAQDLKAYVNSALDAYQNFQKPENLEGCYDGLDFMPSALLDFDVQYAEVKNTYGWNFRNTGSDLYKNKLSGFSPSNSWYLKEIDDSIRRSEKLPTIHVYLTNDGERFDHIVKTKGADYKSAGKAAGQFPSKSNLNRSSQIHLPNVYVNYIAMKYQSPKDYKKSWQDEIRNWFIIDGGKVFTHELGHNFGLSHSNKYHRSNQCKYSIMSQKHGDPRNYLQPTEIKKIHDKLKTTNLMQFVTADSHYGFDQAITSNTLWQNPTRYYNDFTITDGAKLTITDSIIMPNNSSITINKNAIIEIQPNGKVVYPNGDNFTGWNNQGRLIQ